MNNNSGINTLLLVVLLVLIVGFGVWYFTGGFSAPADDTDDASFNVNVDLPEGGEER